MIKEYLEYFVEYDNEHLLVYVSGLDEDGYWDELRVFEEVDNPESFAHGYCESLRNEGRFCTVEKVTYDD